MNNVMPEYEDKNFITFVNDMIVNGYQKDLRHYHGRFWYEGPGVVVPASEIQNVIRSTKVDLLQDNMGLDFILYPRKLS